MKKAKLVEVSFTSRVIVNNNASINEIISKARENVRNRLDQEFSDNLINIEDDIDCPYGTCSDLMDNKLIDVLAHAFSVVLKVWLTKEEIELVNERNSANGYDNKLCASHDFCDANMAMSEAFSNVLGREPEISNDTDGEVWNRAWEWAQKNNFFVKSMQQVEVK